METLLFTTVQNKSGKDVIAPVCFRYNLSSNVMAPLVCCNCVRINGSLWGRSSTFGHDSYKNRYDNFFTAFYICCRHQFQKQLGALGVGCFLWGFLTNKNKRQHQKSFYIKGFFLPIVISVIGTREEIISSQTHRVFVYLYTVKIVKIHTKLKLRNFFSAEVGNRQFPAD